MQAGQIKKDCIDKVSKDRVCGALLLRGFALPCF